LATVFYTSTSLDGFIADSQHKLDWLLQLGAAEDFGFSDFLKDVGAIAMGSTTYQWILDHSSEVDPTRGRWPYQAPAWVFTSRPLSLIPDANLRFARGDVRPVHEEMRAAAGPLNIWIVGGGELAAQFYDQGLLDRMVVSVASVTLGAGTPLFPRRTDPRLQLTRVKQHGDKFAELWYDVIAPAPTHLPAKTANAG
jgi:dihydrofolate reductase